MTQLRAVLTTGTLHATATGQPAGDRVREGILVPWDEPGRTNLGHGVMVRRTFAAGLRPDAKVVGVYGHNADGAPAPAVSRLLAWEDRPEGLWGRIRVARTPLGDQLLAEIDDGVRDGVSIESDAVLDDAGHIVAGSLDFFAHVPVGAYDSARVQLVAAATQHDRQGDSVTQPNSTPAPATGPATTAPAPVAPALSQDQFAQLLAALQPAVHVTSSAPASAPASVPAGLPTTGVPATSTDQTSAVQRVAQLQAQLFRADGNAQSSQLRAALADITNTGLDLFQSPAGAASAELWSGAGYTRRFVPLVSKGTLTSWKFGGWRWVNKPKVQDYAGDKTEIPTNPVSVEPVESEAERCAGGWDVDRKFRDFGDAGFWAGFYAAQTESYLELSDQRCAAAIVAGARDVTVDANVPAGYADTNIAQDGILRAVAYGNAVMEDTPNVRRAADFVVMNTQDWLSLMDLTQLDLPAFLGLLGVSPSSFLRSPLVPSGRVILGCKPALTFYELGAVPIRVEALDVARAGIDSAVYGYTGSLLNRPGGIISVPLAAAG